MVAESTLKKQANGLVTLFLTRWTEAYPNRQPEINRYKHRWGFQDMAEDLGYERAKVVIDYYFYLKKPGHPIQQLLNNYEKLDQRLREKEKDERDREALRKETEERVKMWEEKVVNS